MATREGFERPLGVRVAEEGYERVFGPVDAEAFVREVFDGAVGDVGPFLTRDAAETAIRSALEAKIRRTLARHEADRLGMYVVLEWNRRKPEVINWNSPEELYNAGRCPRP